MNVREAILERRTVHRYSTEPIPDGAIERAIECAIAAPNHKLTNPWRFTQVGPEGRGAIENLYVKLKRETSDGLSDEREERYRRKVGNPPALVVPSQVLAEDDFTRREDYAAVACAIQNFMLSLRGDGIFAKWTTGSVTRQPETYEILDIDPDEEEIVGFVWVGYPREDRVDVEKPGRRPVDEVVRERP